VQLRGQSVCALVFRRIDGDKIRYLMLRRTAGRGGFWQSVSGNLDRDESAERAVRREVREETGIEPMTVVLLDKVNVFFNPSEETIFLEPCFGVEVADERVILSHEHDAHRWVDLHEALDLISFAGVREALAELDRRLMPARRSSPDG
jgi:dATP pyrophosphohydrolase